MDEKKVLELLKKLELHNRHTDENNELEDDTLDWLLDTIQFLEDKLKQIK